MKRTIDEMARMGLVHDSRDTWIMWVVGIGAVIVLLLGLAIRIGLRFEG